MSQRASGYERKERDLYETPAWVTEALIPHLPKGVNSIWEPACGSGKMVRALQEFGGYEVEGSDIADEEDNDFLTFMGSENPDAIVTNPPYELATEFVEHALSLTEAQGGVVAMLLRTDFDHAKTRSHLFAQHPAFAKKIVLTKRIRWFEESTGSPSFNHAWFIWNWRHQGAPTLAYAP
jgi:hypothetical protein